jgi:hypothetical protein
MWSSRHYKPFLDGTNAVNLDAKWFKWFMGEWNVARTIKREKKESVRLYLDKNFRAALHSVNVETAVDDAAQHIQSKSWSARKSSSGQSSLPISLVSKVGFFLRPDVLVPIDRYARKGLNKLRRDVGDRQLKSGCYREYLTGFNEAYRSVQPELVAAMEEPWVIALANKLNCPTAALKTTAMFRKVLDNYLMHRGGR